MAPELHLRNWGLEQAGDEPVVNVSHNDAAEFCIWLSNKEGKNYRLPTEAEWEYACRAGRLAAITTGTTRAKLTKIGNVADATLMAKLPGGPWRNWSVKSSDGYAFPSPRADSSRIISGCMTCSETCGSGVRIGTTKTTT